MSIYEYLVEESFFDILEEGFLADALGITEIRKFIKELLAKRRKRIKDEEDAKKAKEENEKKERELKEAKARIKKEYDALSPREISL